MTPPPDTDPTTDALEACADMLEAGFVPAADDVAAVVAGLRDARRRIEDALIHYQIGQETTWGDLYVDWRYVALRMAEALSPAALSADDGEAAEGHRLAHDALYGDQEDDAR